MEKNFKYDLETIYNEVDRLAKEYQAEGKTATEKHFILSDILEVSKELVMNHCHQFLRGRTTTVTAEELYAVAITEPLLDVLNWHDFNQGKNIMVNWISFMDKRFNNAIKSGRTKKVVWEKTHVYSADKPLTEDGVTICDLVGEEDFSEGMCARISIGEMLESFEKKDKHGKIIRSLLLRTQEARREAFLEVLGAEKYGDNERKAVERTKKRFVKFLIHNNYDLTGYNIEKFI